MADERPDGLLAGEPAVGREGAGREGRLIL